MSDNVFHDDAVEKTHEWLDSWYPGMDYGPAAERAAADFGLPGGKLEDLYAEYRERKRC